jgi:hypothetical protein
MARKDIGHSSSDALHYKSLLTATYVAVGPLIT